jgi:hypothetical protein
VIEVFFRKYFNDLLFSARVTWLIALVWQSRLREASLDLFAPRELRYGSSVRVFHQKRRDSIRALREDVEAI